MYCDLDYLAPKRPHGAGSEAAVVSTVAYFHDFGLVNFSDVTQSAYWLRMLYQVGGTNFSTAAEPFYHSHLRNTDLCHRLLYCQSPALPVNKLQDCRQGQLTIFKSCSETMRPLSLAAVPATSPYPTI